MVAHQRQGPEHWSEVRILCGHSFNKTIKKCANLAEGIVYEHIGKDYFAIMKEYGEIPISIMMAALMATADMILERDPKENYAFKIILQPYKKKEP